MGPKNTKTHIFPSVPDLEGETMRGAQKTPPKHAKNEFGDKKIIIFPGKCWI